MTAKNSRKPSSARKRKCKECGKRSGIVTLNGIWVCLQCFEAKLKFFQEYLMYQARKIDEQYRNKGK